MYKQHLQQQACAHRSRRGKKIPYTFKTCAETLQIKLCYIAQGEHGILGFM